MHQNTKVAGCNGGSQPANRPNVNGAGHLEPQEVTIFLINSYPYKRALSGGNRLDRWVGSCVCKARAERKALGGSDLGAFLSRNGRTGEAVCGRMLGESGHLDKPRVPLAVRQAS